MDNLRVPLFQETTKNRWYNHSETGGLWHCFTHIDLVVEPFHAQNLLLENRNCRCSRLLFWHDPGGAQFWPIPIVEMEGSHPNGWVSVRGQPLGWIPN